ncbi:hypothetical protein [Nitrincola tapanii]|uniref:Carboxypeptidase regulatory-like domain-containing protein n=1 Tax=Nitrincola tapanii TaxID=1708751 RepID=A0A5A9W6H1_9GAMM|nr:hypothetical protein [Nitrincola tapanii]KAA0875795.1 hypothetical protein E1H14_03665 [Nitrincola tapanii]
MNICSRQHRSLPRFSGLMLSLLLGFGLPAQAENLPYWTGGIGLESRQEAPMHNTRVEFFDSDRAYISEIEFEISNTSGAVLVRGVAEGPWLILELPQGEYQIRGKRLENGDIQAARFRVSSGSGQQIIRLRYPNP